MTNAPFMQKVTIIFKISEKYPIGVIYTIHAIHHAEPYVCNICNAQHTADDALFMNSITTGWRPPKAAASPLLWTRAPKAPAS